MDERIDPEEMFKSLNGFEEISIEKTFRTAAFKLATAAEQGDPVPLMRALLFVEEKRAGAKDGEAYRSVMTRRVDEVVGRFRPRGETDEVDEGKAPEPTATRHMPPSLSAPESPSPWMSTSV